MTSGRRYGHGGGGGCGGEEVKRDGLEEKEASQREGDLCVRLRIVIHVV